MSIKEVNNMKKDLLVSILCKKYNKGKLCKEAKKELVHTYGNKYFNIEMFDYIKAMKTDIRKLRQWVLIY